MSEIPLQNQTQLDRIFQSAPLGIGLVDDQLRIAAANSTLIAILDFQEEQLQEICFADLCHSQDREDLNGLFDPAGLPPGSYNKEEIRLQQAAGAYHWFEITVSLIPPGEELSGQHWVIFQDIQQRKEMELELAELHRRLNDRVEEQRVQLAQDLHDGAMQDLHSIQYQLSALQGSLSRETQDQVEAVMDTVRQVQGELRTISYDLRPPALSRFGLAKSIRSHAKEFIENHPEFTLSLDLMDDGTLLKEEIRLALFRIYQQALGNILQHSGASEIKVSLWLEENAVELRIKDDGIGFSVPESWISLVREGHYGLAGSHDRVRSLGGEFKVRSQSDQGTEILVRISDVMESEA